MLIPPDHVLAWRDISCVGHPSHRCLLEAASMILCRRRLLDGVRSKKIPVFQRDTMPFTLNRHAMIYTN